MHTISVTRLHLLQCCAPPLYDVLLDVSFVTLTVHYNPAVAAPWGGSAVVQCFTLSYTTQVVFSRPDGLSYIHRLSTFVIAHSHSVHGRDLVSTLKPACQTCNTKCMIHWGPMAADCSHSKA